MPGKGKLHEYHMCQTCRKSVLDMLENRSINYIK
jgi:hypothetical protein